MSRSGDAHVRRNFVLNVLEGGTYLSSTGFISVQTVLPALVARLGGTNVQVGAVSVIAFVGSFFPQVFAARYAEASPWKKPMTVGIGLAQRLVMAALGVAMLVLGRKAPQFALAAFFLLFSCNQVLSGIGSPFWADFIAKVTPLHQRGRLVGLRTSLGGGGAFLGGFVLTWLLTAFEFPESYGLAFMIAAALQIVSVVIQARVVEAAPTAVPPRRTVRDYLRTLRSIVTENRSFSRFVAAMALIILGSMPVAFFTVYALHNLGAGEVMVGEFTISMVLVQIVSAIVNGQLADRRGNKTALMVAGGAIALASLTALLVTSPGWFRLVFLLVGVNIGTEVMARYNMALEFSPEHQRSTFIGLMNTLLAPCYAAGLIGGVLIDLLGFHAVFVAGLVCSLAGVAMLAFFVDDPRHRRSTMEARTR